MLLHVKHQKFVKTKKTEIELSIVMYKYAQLKRFHHEIRLQVYMYDFMYVDPETMLVEEHFPATKRLLIIKRKFQLQEQSQNIGLDLVT